jgi:hypothetical protein
LIKLTVGLTYKYEITKKYEMKGLKLKENNYKL